MKKSKKITLTAAAMVLQQDCSRGTLAYLNSVTETKTNTFTSGKNITTTLQKQTGQMTQVKLYSG